MTLPRFEWTSARDVAEAAAGATTTVSDAMLAARDAGTAGPADLLKAGGVDLLDLMKEGLLAPRRLISLKDVAGLDQIAEDREGGPRIGALATLEKAAAHPLVRGRYRALADALAGSASPQIRSVATLGGNILQRPRCWYFRSDAQRCLRRGGGRCFAMHGENQYHAIFACIPRPPRPRCRRLTRASNSSTRNARRDGLRSASSWSPPKSTCSARTISSRARCRRPCCCLAWAPARSPRIYAKPTTFDWPIADVAVALERDDQARCRRAVVVLGAAAPVPHRARAAEDFLMGKSIDETVARAAGEAALEGATPLAKNRHKLAIFAVLVRRTLLRAADQG